MFLALVIIWGDYFANSKKAREAALMVVLLALCGMDIFLPSNKAIIVLRLAFASVFISGCIVWELILLSLICCIVWELNKSKLPRRLRAARIAWDMGYSASRAWWWGKSVVK